MPTFNVFATVTLRTTYDAPDKAQAERWMSERIKGVDDSLDRVDPEMTLMVTLAPMALESPGLITNVTIELV
jgi:hypothetical protein